MTAAGTGAADAGQARRVSWSLSAHARGLLTLALAGLVIAVLTGRPEFAGVAAPAVLLAGSPAGPRHGGDPGQCAAARRGRAGRHHRGDQRAR